MSDWWSRRLSGERPAPRPMQQNYPVATPPPPTPSSDKATHKKRQGICPGCGGDNYFSASENSRKRCYDCGYPVEQQSTGMTASGPATPARQVPSAGYQPTNTIAGRVG